LQCSSREWAGGTGQPGERYAKQNCQERTGGTRQPGEDRRQTELDTRRGQLELNSQAGEGRWNWTVKRVQSELDSYEKAGGTGQLGQCRRNCTTRRGQAELDSQERAGGTGQPGEGRRNCIARRGQAELDSQERAGGTGQPGEVRRNWAARREQAELDSGQPGRAGGSGQPRPLLFSMPSGCGLWNRPSSVIKQREEKSANSRFFTFALSTFDFFGVFFLRAPALFFASRLRARYSADTHLWSVVRCPVHCV
jgi:hypothetical protein